MGLEWKEIFLESNSENSTSKNHTFNKTKLSTSFSPIETLYSVTKPFPKKQKNKFIYFILFLFMLYQIGIAYFTFTFYNSRETNSDTKNAERYLDILEDTISLEMSYILQDAKKYWTILKFVNVENSHKLNKIYFSHNEQYLYFGVFQRVGRELYSKLEFFNYSLLGNSKLPLEEFLERIEGIEISLLSPLEGVPYLYNLSEKRDQTEICIAVIPTTNQILILGFHPRKWNELLAKRNLGTYILLNHQGVVLAHSSPDIVKNATDYSHLKYFDFIAKRGEFYTSKEFISPSGKKVKVFARKLIPFESYLVYMIESENSEDTHFLYFISFSLLGGILAFFILYLHQKKSYFS